MNNNAPTKNNLMKAQKSLRLARLGYDLMDKKRNILLRELVKLTDELNSVQRELCAVMNDASGEMRRANLTLGSLAQMQRLIPAEKSVSVTSYSVMGVTLSHVTCALPQPVPYYGLNTTDSHLDSVYLSYCKALPMIMKLSELENNISRMCTAVEKAQKRTNALKNVVIPDLTSTEKLISDALAEKEREDFFRMKVIKSQKQ